MLEIIIAIAGIIIGTVFITIGIMEKISSKPKDTFSLLESEDIINKIDDILEKLDKFEEKQEDVSRCLKRSKRLKQL